MKSLDELLSEAEQMQEHYGKYGMRPKHADRLISALWVMKAGLEFYANGGVPKCTSSGACFDERARQALESARGILEGE